MRILRRSSRLSALRGDVTVEARETVQATEILREIETVQATETNTLETIEANTLETAQDTERTDNDESETNEVLDELDQPEHTELERMTPTLTTTPIARLTQNRTNIEHDRPLNVFGGPMSDNEITQLQLHYHHSSSTGKERSSSTDCSVLQSTILSSANKDFSRLLSENQKRIQYKKDKANKRLKSYTPQKRYPITFDKILNLYVEATKVHAINIRFTDVTRKYKLLALEHLKQGPHILTEVKYYKEKGEGPGVMFDFVSSCLTEILEKYGTGLGDYYLPPSDNIVANNHQIQQDLYTCGCLMQIGLMMGINKDGIKRTIQLANWHPLVYYFCLQPKTYTSEQNLRNIVDGLAQCENGIFSSNRTVEDMEETMSRYECTNFIEKIRNYAKADGKEFNDIPLPLLQDCTYQGLIESRHLAYKHIQKGFIANNEKSHSVFEIIDYMALYDSIELLQLQLSKYTGEDLVDKLVFDSFCQLETKQVVQEEIRNLNGRETLFISVNWLKHY